MNLKLFKKRLISFYSCWKRFNRDYWGNSDVIVINTPPKGSSPADSHPVSSYFFLWLLGKDFPDTITIFTRSDIYFICTKKKTTMLQNLVGPAFEASELRVSVTQKDKGSDGLEKMDDILRNIRTAVCGTQSEPNWPSHGSKIDSILLNFMKVDPQLPQSSQEVSRDGDQNSRPLVVGYISGECNKSRLLWSCYKNSNMKYKGTSVSLGFVKLFDRPVKSDNVSEEKSDTRKGLELVLEDLISKLDCVPYGFDRKDENANLPSSSKVKKAKVAKSSSEAKVANLPSSSDANVAKELEAAKVVESEEFKAAKAKGKSVSLCGGDRVVGTKELEAAKAKGKSVSLCGGDRLKKSLRFEAKDDSCADEYFLVPGSEECGDWEFVDANEVDGMMNKVEWYQSKKKNR